MPHPCLDCSAVPGCGFSNWDLFFAIARPADVAAGICRVAVGDPSYLPYYPQFTHVGDNDSITGLQGQWSNTATLASTMPSTGFDGAPWQNIENALQEDGSYASIQPTSRLLNQNICGYAGSTYLVLTGFNFNIPPNSTIRGIASAIKGYNYTRGVGTGTIYTYAGSRIYNVGLVYKGQLYPFADPSQDFNCNNSAQGQPPWPNDPFQVYTQAHDTSGANWPAVFDRSWYDVRNPATFGVSISARSVPSSSQTSIRNLLYVLGNSGLGNQIACPDLSDVGLTTWLPVSFRIGPVAKTLLLTPTKQVWSDVEINDPTFGIAISVWTTATTTSVVTSTTFIFLDCAGLGVYYTPSNLKRRNKIWTSS